MTEIVEFRSFEHLLEIAARPRDLAGPVLYSRRPAEELVAQCANLKHGIFDFDGTLIAGNQHAEIRKMLVDSVPALTPLEAEIYAWMTADRTAASIKDFMGVRTEDVWFADLREPTLEKRAEMEGAWIGMDIGALLSVRFKKMQITQVGLALSAKSRSGGQKLFGLLQNKCIISWGYQQVIEAWLDCQQLEAMVAATCLIFDHDLRVCGYHPGTVVTGATKASAAQLFKQKNGVQHEGVLSVGDTAFDLDMMERGENRVNVLIFSPADAAKGSKFTALKNHAYAEQFDKITAILISDSLEPLADLIESGRSLGR